MADVHAVLRHDLHDGGNGSHMSFGASAWHLPRGAWIGAGSMGWTNPQAVALFRTSCEVLDVSAFLSHPTAPHLAAFYLAIARSAVCASPVPHNSSLSCDLTRIRRSAQAAVSVQTHCSRYVDSLAGRTCVHVRQMDRNQDAGAASAVPVVCWSNAGRRQADGSRSGTHPGITCA